MTQDTRADLRRRALRETMAKRGLKPAEIARMAGLSNANAIYNLLHGRSKSLSAETYEKIIKALPDATMAEMTGVKEPVASSRGVPLRTIAQAGLWRERFELPLQQQTEIQLPVTSGQLIAGAFAARVEGPGADRRWRRGAILLCIPPQNSENPIANGSWVVLERIAHGKVEVTARQVEVENGKAWLWLRTNDPRHVPAIPVSWPCDGRPWRHEGERLQIAGIVEGAWEQIGAS